MQWTQKKRQGDGHREKLKFTAAASRITSHKSSYQEWLLVHTYLAEHQRFINVLRQWQLHQNSMNLPFRKVPS